jgi:N-methylhydantoinase B
MDRVTNPPEGLEGGEPGARAGIWRNGVTPFPPKGRGELAPGETLVIHSPGGGGYGAAAQRAPQRLRHDLREEFVSREAATDHYRSSET